jgi:hypothetical protein
VEAKIAAKSQAAAKAAAAKTDEIATKQSIAEVFTPVTPAPRGEKSGVSLPGLAWAGHAQRQEALRRRLDLARPTDGTDAFSGARGPEAAAQSEAKRASAVAAETAALKRTQTEEESLQQREEAAKVRMRQAQSAVMKDKLGKIEGPNRAPPGAKEGFTIEMAVRLCRYGLVMGRTRV